MDTYGESHLLLDGATRGALVALLVVVSSFTSPETASARGTRESGGAEDTSVAQTGSVFTPEEINAPDRDLFGRLDFAGRYIVSVSDADMVSSAYVNGMLGPREGTDAVSVIPLTDDPREWRAYEVEASNSVAGPPAAVDVTPDGRYAFVIETFTRRPDGGDEMTHTFADFSVGDRLSVIDLSNPRNPVLHQEVTIPARPDAVRVSPDGGLVAIGFNPEGAGAETPIGLYPFEGGRVGEAVFPAIPQWTAGDRLIDLDFHPDGDILALLNEVGANVRFVEIVRDGGELTLELYGNVVETEKAQYRIEFTPDGRHVVANALYWGVDVQGFWNEAPRGSVFSVRMNAGTYPDGTPRHALVSRAITGVSPEGLAVSPDGRWVVTTNLERSYLPYDDPRITWFSSLTLVRLDPETGALTRIGDYTYDGILPEAAVFDNSSSSIAVVTYDHFDDRRVGGSVDFWRIAGDPLDPERVELVKSEYSVPVTRGAHSMVIVR